MPSIISSERFIPDSASVATTICLTSCFSMKPCCLRSYNLKAKSILSSIGALGWNTERARANSSNSRIPLCFVSNKSNTRSANMLSFLLVLNKANWNSSLLIKPSSTTALLIFLNSSYRASISFTLKTVSLARRSGSSRPFGRLGMSRSQHLSRAEASRRTKSTIAHSTNIQINTSPSQFPLPIGAKSHKNREPITSPLRITGSQHSWRHANRNPDRRPDTSDTDTKPS
uniref:Uncharacterized protein n=1 Tax=Zea mays TaxID=4577 RepID=C4IZL9_MAIZE|nr:unknown [Zea mays]